MVKQMSRRNFIAGAARAAAAIAIIGGLGMVSGCADPAGNSFDFLLLGDVHLDRIEHHDMEWMKREKPGVIRECQAYCRITRENTPLLFGQLRRQVESNGRIKFVVQLGDLVEGLAGRPDLARRHSADAVKFIRDARLGVPFLHTKGNHDRVGPGGQEAFDAVMRPFVAEEYGRLPGHRQRAEPGKARARGLTMQQSPHSSYAHSRGDTLFVHYDAYPPFNLDWVEKTLAKRTEKRLIFFLHQPIVPYSPRATWCIYAHRSQKKRRQRLMNLLGEHRAIVFSAHLHDHAVVVRRTDRGPFVQVASCSVLPRLPVAPRKRRSGLENYGPDIVMVDPRIQPPGKAHTEQMRRAFLEAEAPFITHYEYAIAPGYALISVRDDGVHAQFFCGLEPKPFRAVNLTSLLQKEGAATGPKGQISE
ncbi:MAG: metallophosphoesterase family protein [Planctomycetota bacterium]|jgi:hypothetical protein